MDRVSLRPFGHIEKTNVARLFKLGNTTRLKAQLYYPWRFFEQHLRNTIDKFPSVSNFVLKTMIGGFSEQNLSKQEQEQLESLFQALENNWNEMLYHLVEKLAPAIKQWLIEAQRGFFRLMVLLVILLLQKKENVQGRSLLPPKLGGRIRKELLTRSNNTVEAKAGSLYIALEDFKQAGFLEYEKENDMPVEITPSGLAFISGMLSNVKNILKHLILNERIAIFSRINQAMIDTLLQLDLQVNDREAEPVKLESIMKNTNESLNEGTYLTSRIGLPDPDWIVNINDGTVEKFENENGQENITVLENLGDWSKNFNRGLIDIFILSLLLKEPAYGNQIIEASEESLNFHAGTLYPKMKRYIESGIVRELDKEKDVILLSTIQKRGRGPEKRFYDVTIQGLLYFTFILVKFLEQVDLIYQICDSLGEMV